MKYKPGDILVRSVKHTGTNFIDRLLRDNGVGSVRCGHWSTPDLPDPIIICPIRDPYQSWITWFSRNRFGVDYVREWTIFNQAFLDKNLNMFIVPIDTIDRQFYLDKLSAELGHLLFTDWKPVDSSNRYEEEAPSIDLSKIYNLEVVRHFYAQ